MLCKQVKGVDNPAVQMSQRKSIENMSSLAGGIETGGNLQLLLVSSRKV